MSLIDNFSKPRWQHAKPEIRRDAIDQLDDPEVLFDIASSDPDIDVRAHALARVTSSKDLDQLIEKLPQALQQQARDQRLKQLLPDPGELSSISDDDLLLHIASLAEDEETVRAAVAQLHSLDARMDVARKHPLAKVRLCAAQGIEDIEKLHQLAHDSKHKDKAVYRYCKELLDQHNLAEREQAERQSKIQQLLEDAEQMSSGVDSPGFKGRHFSLDRHWQMLKEYAQPEQQAKIQEALDVCAERIAIKSETRAAEADEQLRISEARQAFPVMIAELEDLDRSITQAQEIPVVTELRTTLNNIEDRWLAAARLAPASADQTFACKKHLKQWRTMAQSSQNLLDHKAKLEKNRRESEKTDPSDFVSLHRQQERTEKLISKLRWPESHQAIKPELIQQLDDRLADLRKKLSQLKANEKQHRDQLESAFERLRTELETNHFKNADRALKKVRHELRQLSPGQQQQYQTQLRPMMARLNEIHDWQGFAIEPKKIELCERMDALVASSETADVLATRIKALQLEWKKLGPLSPRRDQQLWNKFKAASDEAYKPCKAAFAEKAVLCQKNFEQRMLLIAQLVEYEEKMAWPDRAKPDVDADADTEADVDEDSTAPDWKLVQKTLDTARQAFRNIKPVDRKGERKSSKALNKICDRIYDHIKQEYGRNISLKEELISRAEALVELENLSHAIDSAKRIQREWKEVGMTPVRVDRQCWKKFRAACDAVFARLDEQREQEKAAMSTQIEQAEALGQQARALLDSKEDDQLLHLKRDLGELQSSLRKIELPRNVQQQFYKRFTAMEREARTIVSDLRRQQEQDSWRRLLDKMKACAGRANDEEQALKLWQQEGPIPKEIDNAALELFWQQGSSDSDKEVQQEACIALEILIEIDSPPEDKQARMAYQMKRLVEGMGSQQLESDQRLLELIVDFIALRPSSEWLERFCRGVEIAKTQ